MCHTKPTTVQWPDMGVVLCLYCTRYSVCTARGTVSVLHEVQCLYCTRYSVCTARGTVSVLHEVQCLYCTRYSVCTAPGTDKAIYTYHYTLLIAFMLRCSKIVTHSYLINYVKLIIPLCKYRMNISKYILTDYFHVQKNKNILHIVCSSKNDSCCPIPSKPS